MINSSPLLEVRQLKKYFLRQKGWFKKTVGTVKAVDDIDFTIKAGETLALVGESGCGKTTAGRCILRAIEPTAGQVYYNINDDRKREDFLTIHKNRLKDIRKDMAMIFQDPYSSLNPRKNILKIIGEPFIVHGMVKSKDDLNDRVAELLEMVRLNPEFMQRYPHAFSGGQRQRIAIARALSLNPKFIVADECVSALDVSVQAQILILLKELQRNFQLTFLFITHDLAVVEYFCNHVAVMYVGKIVETTDTDRLFNTPRHPYTEALLSAVPQADPRIRKESIILEGDIVDPANPPSGCYFHPRCRYVKDVCTKEFPPLAELNGANEIPHYGACHFAKELQLSGVKK